jgi:hypothetical protein
MNKTKLSILATTLVLAMFLLPSATAAFAAQTSALSTTTATFKVVNAHGILQAGVKSVLEINDHVYTKYTNSHGLVSFSLSGYSSTSKLQVDFEKGTLGYNMWSTVGQVIGKSMTITIR